MCDPAGQLAQQLHLFGKPPSGLGFATLLDLRVQKAIGFLEFPGTLDRALFEQAVELAQLAFGVPGPQSARRAAISSGGSIGSTR